MRDLSNNPNRIIQNRKAAEFLGVSRTTYWRLVKSGELPQPVRFSRRIGGQPLDVLEKFVEQRRG